MASQAAGGEEIPKCDPSNMEKAFKKKKKRKIKHKNTEDESKVESIDKVAKPPKPDFVRRNNNGQLITQPIKQNPRDIQIGQNIKNPMKEKKPETDNTPKEDEEAKPKPAFVRKNKNNQLSTQAIKQQPKVIQIGQKKKNPMKVKNPEDDSPKENEGLKPKPVFVKRNKNGQLITQQPIKDTKAIQISQKKKPPVKAKNPEEDNDAPKEDEVGKPKPAIVKRNKNGQLMTHQPKVIQTVYKKKTPMKVKKPEDDVDINDIDVNANNATEALVRPNGFTGITEILGMDCEMVGVGQTGKHSILARVSLVNKFGFKVYDKFVAPRGKVTDYRTAVSGVRPEDLEGAPHFKKVQAEVSNLLKGRILVGHGVHHDLNVLSLNHPEKMIRDTAKYNPFKAAFGGQTPSLKNLVKRFLGVAVQTGEHSSVQDSQAAVRLYMMFRIEWEEKEAKISTNSNSKKEAAKQKPEKPNVIKSAAEYLLSVTI